MLLPPAERRGDICFHFFKRLSYSQRLALSFCVIATGFAVQIIIGQSLLWIGVAIVFLGVLPLLTKGYQNVVRTTSAAEDWRPVHREEIQRIPDIAKRQKTWDHDLFDITSWQGVLMLLLIGIGTWAGMLYVMPSSEPLAIMIAANAAAVFLPFWFTGARRILKSDKLVIKCDMLLSLADSLASSGKEGEEFQFQMRTAGVKGQEASVPNDVKGLVAFHNAPEGFLGVQVQVNINSVQGNDYPYCYCVMVARPEFTAKRPLELSPPPRNVVIEPSHAQDVDIVVIRQLTTKTSGYHTKLPVAQAIFNYAINEARRLVA
jgi:hypothetical protein